MKDEKLFEDLWEFLSDANRIAQLYSFGYGKQPIVWAKHEEERFANWFENDGEKFRNLRKRLKAADQT